LKPPLSPTETNNLESDMFFLLSKSKQHTPTNGETM